MALAVADRVKESTTTTGTGTVNLAGAETGFQTFVAGIGNSNTTYYAIVDGNTGDFEVGIGTVTDASPDTLSRDTILQSSNSDSAVNFGSGTKAVFCTQPADKAVFKNADGNVNLPDNAEFQVGNRATTGDLRIRHNGTQSQIQNYTGQLQITNFTNDSDVRILSDDSSGGVTDYFRADGSNGEAVLYHYGTEKFATKSTGVDVVGNITVSGTVDGRDLATDGTKLDGVEASADVTDATNVTAAGALMDSEVTNLAQVKAFDSSDYATAAQGTTADNALPKAGGTMTGNLTLSGTNTRINMPDDHFINRRFELDAVDASGVGYVLLCRNAASNDVNGRITMDRTSGLRHACQVDIIVSSGSSSNPIGSLKAHGVSANAGSSPNGPSYELVTVTYDSDSNSYVALKITNPDNYYETSGAFFTGRLVNSGSNTLLAVLPSGISSEAQLTDANAKHTFQGDLDLLDNIVIAGTVDGRDLATDGTKLDGIEASADVTDATNVAAAGALMTSGGTITGDVDLNANLSFDDSTGTDNNRIRLGTGNDFHIFHNGTNSKITNNTGALQITNNADDNDVTILTDDGSGSNTTYFRADGSTGETKLFHYGTEKIKTQSGGVDVTGNITVSGTVDGRDLATDGTKLDGIASSATANPNAIDNVVEDTTPQLGGDLDLNSNDITGTGNINITGTLQTSSDATIGGNLTVSGTTTTVNTETINLADNNIVLNSNHTGTPTQNAGITIERGTSTDKVFQWNESSNYWEFDDNIIVSGNGTSKITSAGGTATVEIRPDGSYSGWHPNLLFRSQDTGSVIYMLSNGNNLAVGRYNGGVPSDPSDFITFKSSTGDTPELEIGDAGSTTSTLGLGAQDIVGTSTGVGIGTTSPDGLLHVSSGTSGDATVIIEADTDNNAEGDIPQLWFKADGDITEGAIRLNDNELQIISNVSSGGIEFLTGTTNNTGTTDPGSGATKRMGISDSGIDVTGNITVSGTVDGRDLATDGTKLDGIEASADVTDTTNVTSAGALMTTGGTMTGAVLFNDSVKAKFGTGTDLSITHNGTNSQIVNSTGVLQILQQSGSDVVIKGDDNSGGSSADYFRADGSTGEAMLYHYGTEKLATKSGGVDVSGNITVSGTVDGRDLATDGTKLDGIEASADVTDATNVTAAGALMDSEVTNLAQVKAFDSSDYATAAQGTTADAALPKAGGTMTGNISRGDNVKSIYGTGNDLEIYHTGTNSIINDVGTGNLVLSTNGTSVRIAHSTNAEAMAIFTKNGSALLKHDGSDKLETSSSGVDVTGDIAVTGSMVFEGATADAHETTLAVTDPTADRTITLPDATGTVILNSNLNFPFFKADGSSDTIFLKQTVALTQSR